MVLKYLNAGSEPTIPAMLPVPNATLPYWRTELHKIDEHRSTKNLPEECDIAIIGSGMAGVGTAYHISQLLGEDDSKKDRPSIVLLEAREVCSGATGRNGGHCKIKTDSVHNLVERHGLETAEQVVKHVRDQVYAIKEAVVAEKLDCEFELRRSYDVYLHQPGAQHALAHFDASLQAGQTWTQQVDAIDERSAEQVTSLKGAKGALSVPICSFWPYKFVSQLLAGLVEKGSVNLQTSTPVTSVSQHPENPSSSLIKTPRGSLRAKKVVFATNAYTAGICPQYQNIIVPVRGTACHIVPKPEPVSPHLACTYNIFYASKPERVDYLNPRPDGGIVVGGGKWTFEDDREQWYNNWDDSTQFPGPKAHFDGLMQRHFKGWQDSGAEVDSIWTGIMGNTPDSMPHIGPVPGTGSRHFIIAGFNGGGMGTIFSATKALASMVVEEAQYKDTGLPALFETNASRLS